jgi:hypothetical protein
MPSFEEILNMPVSEIKPPQAYPVGTYHCLIDGPAEPGKSSQKQTDFLRFKFKVLSPMKDVDAAAAAEMQVVGKIITNDYYIVDAAAYRLKEMLIDHLGLEGDNLKELVGQAPGRQILVKLRHEASQDGKRVFHRVDSTAHV